MIDIYLFLCHLGTIQMPFYYAFIGIFLRIYCEFIVFLTLSVVYYRSSLLHFLCNFLGSLSVYVTSCFMFMFQPCFAQNQRPFWPSFAYLSCGGELVENVIVALFSRLKSDSWLLKQIILDEASLDLEFAIEANLHKPAKPRGVIITNSFGITWQKWILTFVKLLKSFSKFFFIPLKMLSFVCVNLKTFAIA